MSSSESSEDEKPKQVSKCGLLVSPSTRFVDIHLCVGSRCNTLVVGCYGSMDCKGFLMGVCTWLGFVGLTEVDLII